MAISCDDYDYLEIACLYAYEVKLQLKSGETVEGKAITTGINEHKQEYLLIESQVQEEANSSSKQQVLLSQLSAMDVLTPNAKFRSVVF
jgi:Rho-binding antiterminator